MFEPINIKDYTEHEKSLLKDRLHNAKKAILGFDMPVLTIVHAGNNDASNRYVRNKIKDCKEVGITPVLISLTEDTPGDMFEAIISKAAEHSDGIIVQLPLPEKLHSYSSCIKDLIPAAKDVDGFRLDSYFEPCTPKGICDYLSACNYDFAGKHAVIIGRSDIVGKPMAKMLLARDMTVSVCHSKTPKEILANLLATADLVICATGKRGIINSSDAPKAFIVDVGINIDDTGKLCGDVIIDSGDESRVTPVPGGVGLLTRLSLLKNVVDAWELNINEN